MLICNVLWPRRAVLWLCLASLSLGFALTIFYIYRSIDSVSSFFKPNTAS